MASLKSNFCRHVASNPLTRVHILQNDDRGKPIINVKIDKLSTFLLLLLLTSGTTTRVGFLLLNCRVFTRYTPPPWIVKNSLREQVENEKQSRKMFGSRIWIKNKKNRTRNSQNLRRCVVAFIFNQSPLTTSAQTSETNEEKKRTNLYFVSIFPFSVLFCLISHQHWLKLQLFNIRCEVNLWATQG